MKCPKCGAGRLAVTHTNTTPGGVTQRRECADCLTSWVSVTLIANEIGPKGTGHNAVAKKVEAGLMALVEAPAPSPVSRVGKRRGGAGRAPGSP